MEQILQKDAPLYIPDVMLQTTSRKHGHDLQFESQSDATAAIILGQTISRNIPTNIKELDA